MRRAEEQITAARRAAYDYLKRFQDVFTHNEREDLAQEVALALLRDPLALREPARIAAFSRTVARRLRCRRLMRYWQQRQQQVDFVAEPAAASPQVAEEFPLAAGLRLPRGVLVVRLQQAIAALPALNGCLVRGRYEGFCCAELAARYGLEVSAVKRRLHRARQRLRRLLLRWVGGLIRDSAPGTVLGATSVDGGQDV